MARKLVVFDVDGTIVSGNVLPQSAVNAIRQIRANGNLAVFFTGRPYTHVDPRVREIGFDGCICTMGGYICIGERVVRDIRPPAKHARKVVELVREAGLDAAFESMAGIQFDLTRPLPAFLQGLKRHFTELGFDTNRSIDEPDFSFDKLCVWTNENSSFQGFDEQVSAYLDCIGKKENMEEWGAKGISTVESVQMIMEHFGVNKEECYAIGDSTNDLPMLRCAAHTIAMGQAPEALKCQVDFVTRAIEADGLAYAMEHYGLI